MGTDGYVRSIAIEGKAAGFVEICSRSKRLEVFLFKEDHQLQGVRGTSDYTKSRIGLQTPNEASVDLGA